MGNPRDRQGPRGRPDWAAGAPGAVVVLVTVAAFLPALQAGFVNWDDSLNFVENPHYRGLGLRQVGWMLTTFHMGHYIPLTWLTLGLDHALWGMDARGYHLTNLLLHAATALGVYFLCLRLLGLALPPGTGPGGLRVGAGLAALFFAVHPLRVESVVWVTERRDVLSGLLYVLALIAYVKAVHRTERPRRGWYRAALALFVGALLSKSIAVTLPVTLLVLDAYPLRRLGGARGWLERSVWLEKLPFFALSAIASVVAFIALSEVENLRTLTQMGLGPRLVLAVYGLAFYLFKTALPLGLVPLYPLSVVTVTWGHFAVVGAATGLALWGRWPAFSAVWLFYAMTLLPVLGLFQNGPQAVADRYSYLSCLGWAALVGGAAALGWRAATPVRALAAAWILALGILTWQQAEVWQSSVRLWSHTVALTPDSRTAHAYLARAHELAGQFPEAIRHYEETLRRSRDKATWHVAIGQVLEKSGDPAGAARRYLEALGVRPGMADACEGLRRLAGGPGVGPDVLGSCVSAR